MGYAGTAAGELVCWCGMSIILSLRKHWDSRSLRRRSSHSHNLELIWLRRGHTRTERKKVHWGFEITGYAPRLISFFLTLDSAVMAFPYEKRKICSKNEQSKSVLYAHSCFFNGYWSRYLLVSNHCLCWNNHGSWWLLSLLKSNLNMLLDTVIIWQLAFFICEISQERNLLMREEERIKAGNHPCFCLTHS